MLSLFCRHLQFVIVSDQNIGKKNENFMSSWYLRWQTFEEVAWQKIEPSEDVIIYIYTPSSSLFIHFSQNDMQPAVSVLAMLLPVWTISRHITYNFPLFTFKTVMYLVRYCGSDVLQMMQRS